MIRKDFQMKTGKLPLMNNVQIIIIKINKKIKVMIVMSKLYHNKNQIIIQKKNNKINVK